MRKWKPHVGLRTVKTALAVTLGLFFAQLRGSPSPIFAAIAAIGAMSRIVSDAVETCVTQFFGILLGVGVSILFVSLFHDVNCVVIGIGMVFLILLCVELKLQFAVSLAGIVFISICLSTDQDALFYGLNRLIDTSIGLVLAMVINVALKPYNNQDHICELLTYYLQMAPSYIENRVLGNYPDLSAMEQELTHITEEIKIFGKQYTFRPKEHKQQVVYLQTCEQLARVLYQELHTLCSMDEQEHLSPQNAERLQRLSIVVLEGKPSHTEADIVGNYHLTNLLNAYEYLQQFLDEFHTPLSVEKS